MVQSLGDLAKLDEPEFGLRREAVDVARTARRHRRCASPSGRRGRASRCARCRAHEACRRRRRTRRLDVELFERRSPTWSTTRSSSARAGARIDAGGAAARRRRSRSASPTTGPGIAAADLPHLFDRFYQSRASVAPATGEGGRGLGLAIVKRIAELHGGEVAVDSRRARARGSHDPAGRRRAEPRRRTGENPRASLGARPTVDPTRGRHRSGAAAREVARRQSRAPGRPTRSTTGLGPSRNRQGRRATGAPLFFWSDARDAAATGSPASQAGIVPGRYPPRPPRRRVALSYHAARRRSRHPRHDQTSTVACSTSTFRPSPTCWSSCRCCSPRTRSTCNAASLLISSDMALAAAVLKAVNSALYGLRGRVQSVQQAITYLGTREVASVTFEMGLRAVFPPAPELEPLWERARVRGLLMGRHRPGSSASTPGPRIRPACSRNAARRCMFRHATERYRPMLREAKNDEELLLLEHTQLRRQPRHARRRAVRELGPRRRRRSTACATTSSSTARCELPMHVRAARDLRAVGDGPRADDRSRHARRGRAQGRAAGRARPACSPCAARAGCRSRSRWRSSGRKTD